MYIDNVPGTYQHQNMCYARVVTVTIFRGFSFTFIFLVETIRYFQSQCFFASIHCLILKRPEIINGKKKKNTVKGQLKVSSPPSLFAYVTQ